MTGTIASIWRHPIKSHGREALETVILAAGMTMPGDRVWAVAHESSKADGSDWAPCANFSRVAKVPALMAITAQLENEGRVTLKHPDRPDLNFDPDQDTDRFLDWIKPLMPDDRAASKRIVRVPGRGMTDSAFPSVTLCSLASHHAVEREIGHPLSLHRWRGNIWIDGLSEWEEFDWLDQDIQLGDAVLRVRERTARCMATAANPETGNRDADTLGALRHWGHQDFCVRAEVVKSGVITVGDQAGLL